MEKCQKVLILYKLLTTYILNILTSVTPLLSYNFAPYMYSCFRCMCLYECWHSLIPVLLMLYHVNFNNTDY